MSIRSEGPSVAFDSDWPVMTIQSENRVSFCVFSIYYPFIASQRSSCYFENETHRQSVHDSSFLGHLLIMVQRLTYRRRLSYNTASNRVRV